MDISMAYFIELQREQFMLKSTYWIEEKKN